MAAHRAGSSRAPAGCSGVGSPSSIGVPEAFFQLQCVGCRAHFVLCPSCYRGHRYCSPLCSSAGRRLSVRAARRRYRESTEGREDHRDWMRAYRARRRSEAGRVGDQGSAPSPLASTVPDAEMDSAKSTENPDERPTPVVGFRRCRVCGTSCEWLTPLDWAHPAARPQRRSRGRPSRGGRR